MNFFFDHLAFFDVLGKGLAVLVLGFALQSARRQASAGQRSLAWLPAFVVLALLPCTLLVKPWWAWTVVQAPTLPPAPPSQPLPFVAETAPLPQESPTPSWSLNWMDIALAAWVTGACAVLMFRLIGEWQLRRLHKTSLACEDRRLHHHLEWLAEELGVQRAIDVRQSACISVPLTWGWLKPVLLLPAHAAAWDDERLDAALRHELGHMRHHDACNRWLATLVCALWWPLPIAWMAARAWKLEQEKACDDLVLRAGASAQDYAMQLLAAARSFSPGIGAAMAMARPSTLETRLRAVMDEQRNRRPVNTSTRLRAGISALALTSLCVLAQLQAAVSEPVVHVEAQVIEAPTGTLAALTKKTPNAEGAIVMASQEWAAVKEALARTPQAHLLSRPAVYTRGNVATLQVGDGKSPLQPKAGELPVRRLRITIQPQFKTAGLQLNLAMLLTLEGARQGEFTESLVKASALLKEGSVLALIDPKIKDAGHEVFCFMVPRIVPDKQPAPAPGDALTAAQKKASQIILRHVKFRGTSLDEALDYLRIQSRDLDPARTGVNIVSSEDDSNLRITLDLQDVPLSEALMYCAQLTNNTVSYREDAAVVHQPGQAQGASHAVPQPPTPAPPSANGLPPGALEVAAQPGAPKPIATALPTAATESPVMARAKAIVLPRVEFSGATLTEAVDFFRAKSRDLDPQHQGLNIILKPGTDKGQKITLSLSSVPLSEAMNYVTMLAEVKMEADAHSLVLSPK